MFYESSVTLYVLFKKNKNKPSLPHCHVNMQNMLRLHIRRSVSASNHLRAPELNHAFHAGLSVAPKQLQPRLITLYESSNETLKDFRAIFV